MCVIFVAVSRGLRHLICFALIGLLSAGMSALPGTVLCVAPENHFAVEFIDGWSCSRVVQGPHGTVTQSQDNCPKGCRDTRLSVDEQHPDGKGIGPMPALLTAPTLSRIAAHVRRDIAASARRSPGPDSRPRLVILLC